MAIELLHSAGKKLFEMKFIRYALVGGTSTAFSFFATVFITEHYGVNYLLPYGITLALVTLFNFWLAMKFIFRVNENYGSRFLRYIIVYVANVVLVNLTEKYLQVHYAFAIIVVTILLFLAKFLIYDHFVFHKSKEAL